VILFIKLIRNSRNSKLKFFNKKFSKNFKKIGFFMSFRNAANICAKRVGDYIVVIPSDDDGNQKKASP